MVNNELGEILGYVTALINFFLFLPQVIHVFKVKDTNSISTSFILLQIVSCISTLSYAITIDEKPLMVSSISIMLSSSAIGYAKWVLYPSPIKYEYDEIV